MAEHLLEMNHITKVFPGTKALDNVSFNLKAGEIHAIIGENGAGKSTFIQVLTGVFQPDGGEIILDGKKVVMSNPVVAEKHGISAIYQHPASYPDLSVAENIYIGHEFKTGPFVNWAKTNREAQKTLDSAGANFQATAPVSSLSVAQQQLVEIAKALSQNARILIMDEPTAALSRRESEELYEIAKNLRDKGVAIILISHRFEDIFGLADRVTVFRDAHSIGTWDIHEVDEPTLVRHMVGHEIGDYFPAREPKIGKEVLRIENMSREGYFRNVCLHVHAGEIVGVTGLVGAGRTEVIEALFGVTGADSGKVFIDGKEITGKRSPRRMMDLGLGWLPEDRARQGLHLRWGIKQNISLPIIDECRNGLFIADEKERAISEEMKDLLSIKAPSVDTTPNELSGGNQQKVVIGKLLAAKSKILILDEPTKGVDVGSKAQIYRLMNDLVSQGKGILMISSEMPEVMNMSDRIYVVCEGRITMEAPAKQLSQEDILKAAMNTDSERRCESESEKKSADS